MSFAALTGAATLTVDRAPVILGRFDGGGPPRYVDYGIDGQPVVTQYPLGSGVPSRPELRLCFTLLTAAQLATLDTILNAAGTISVLTKSNASAITCIAAPRSQQKIEPMVGAYRDDMALTDLMLWKAELTFIRLS